MLLSEGQDVEVSTHACWALAYITSEDAALNELVALESTEGGTDGVRMGEERVGGWVGMGWSRVGGEERFMQ